MKKTIIDFKKYCSPMMNYQDVVSHYICWCKAIDIFYNYLLENNCIDNHKKEIVINIIKELKGNKNEI